VFTFALALLADVSEAVSGSKNSNEVTSDDSDALEEVEPYNSTPVEEYYQDWSLQYLNKLHKATKSHEENVIFIKNMMKVDYLWWPILSETVNVKQPTLEFYDQYSGKEPTEDKTIIVLPFEIILKLLNSNTFTGSDVMLAMDALKSGMACSVLKHVSFQGLMLYVLLTKHPDVPEEHQKLFTRWLKEMVQLAINKLIAMEHPENTNQPITNVHELLIEMWHHNINYMSLEKLNATTIDTTLLDIGLKMWEEINDTCAIPTGENIGHYGTLVQNLNKKNIVEEMKVHRTQFTETLREAFEINAAEINLNFDGDIKINENISVDDFKNDLKIDRNTIIRAIYVNHIQMNFFYLNVPIQTFDDSHWIYLSKLYLMSKRGAV